MGDCNRVQSYIKSHVLPKLDSLPDDVANVKNAFDAWKTDWTQARAFKLDNLDAKVSTRATAADMSTALERVATLQTNLQNVTERVETIEKDVRNDAKMHAVKGVYTSVQTTGKQLVARINGKGKLYFAGTAANALPGVKLIVTLDGNRVVSITNNSGGGIPIGISTDESFYGAMDKSVANSRITELTNVLSSPKLNAKINGIERSYKDYDFPPTITISEDLFADKEINIEITKFSTSGSSVSGTFGRYKGYPFEKSLEVFADFSGYQTESPYPTSLFVSYDLEG